MATAVATTAATIATITAINTSMNAEGSAWNQLKETSDASYKAVTTEEALEQMAIAAITAGVTQGATNGLEKAGYIQKVATNADAATRLTTNLSNASLKVTVGATANALANTAVKGGSLIDNLKSNLTGEEAVKKMILQTLAEGLAKEIGFNAHKVGGIDKSTQLVLHGALGCAISSANGNCLAGAAGAIAGELIAENYFRNQLEQNGAIIEGNSIIMCLRRIR